MSTTRSSTRRTNPAARELVDHRRGRGVDLGAPRRVRSASAHASSARGVGSRRSVAGDGRRSRRRSRRCSARACARSTSGGRAVWPCAAQPIARYSPSLQYSRLWRHSSPGRAQFETSYHSNPAAPSSVVGERVRVGLDVVVGRGARRPRRAGRAASRARPSARTRSRARRRARSRRRASRASRRSTRPACRRSGRR